MTRLEPDAYECSLLAPIATANLLSEICGSSRIGISYRYVLHMSLFAWDPSFSIDHAEIDTQHQGLFKVADNLHSAMLCGDGKTAIGVTFAALINYSKYHFASEEALMRSVHYPAYESHRAEHQAFIQRVYKFSHELQKGNKLTIDTLMFLRDWLKDHIAGRDTLIAKYIAEYIPAKSCHETALMEARA